MCVCVHVGWGLREKGVNEFLEFNTLGGGREKERKKKERERRNGRSLGEPFVEPEACLDFGVLSLSIFVIVSRPLRVSSSGASGAATTSSDILESEKRL